MKIISICVAVVFLASLSFASTDNSQALKNVKSDGSFEGVYPKALLETGTGQVVLIVGSAIVIGGITYFTAGTGTAATAGPIVTWVGTQIGGVAGLSGIAATNSGLALLGGGAVAGGGYGVLGGITVLNVLGDLTLSVTLEGGVARIPKKFQKYSLIKIDLPKVGDPAVIKLIDSLSELKENFNDNSADLLFHQIATNSYLEQALNILDHIDTRSATPGYDYIMKGIIEYNLGRYENSSRSLDSAEAYLDNKAVYYYCRALLSLTDGDIDGAKDAALKAQHDDPSSAKPYILYAQIATDIGEYSAARHFLELGLDKADDNEFTLNYLLASLNYFSLNDFSTAMKYYKAALKKISINEKEAECKLMIARCYLKLEELENAKKWYASAFKEIDDNPVAFAEMKNLWEKGL